MKADLHMHSTFSDGSASIARLAEMAEEKGLDAIAVTDHDTFSHMEQLAQLAQLVRLRQPAQAAQLTQPAQSMAGAGVQIIGGIELSAVEPKTNMRAHILGYHIQKPEIVAALTQPLLEARNKNSEKQAEILIGLGYRIDMDKLARAGGKYLYKQHIMDWLVTTGQAPEMFGDFYRRVFKNGGVCAFDIAYVSVFDAVKAIKEAGGLAVLAHPGQQQNFYLIPALVKAGLDGVEVNHHTHSEKDRETVRDYAGRFGLFMTGGSDYHGRYEPQPFGVGDFLSDESGAEAICRG